MEYALTVKCTYAGLERANDRGKMLGRPAKTTPEQQAEMIRLYAGSKGESVSALARTFKISRASVLAVVKPKEAAAAPAAQPTADAAPKARHGAKKAARANRKPAAVRMDNDDNDMARRTALEQEYGQHHLHM